MGNETLQVIRQRRSTRRFRDEQVRAEEVGLIVEAGQCAPYAQEGSRHITIIQNKDLLCKLNLIAKETALHMGEAGLTALGKDESFHSFHHAPTLVIVSGMEQSVAPESDCAAATQNMLIAAESLGVGACWVFFGLLAFFSPQGPELLKALQIPAGHKPYTSVALGYKQDVTDEPPERKLSPVTFIR